MHDKFIFGTVDSSDYKIGIWGDGIYDVPEKDIERINVPGRNGELTIDKERFNNVSVRYHCYLRKGFKDRFPDFMAALHKLKGYQRIYDSYNPNYFRQGVLIDGFDPLVQPRANTGEFDIVFNCKPQRFLISGDEVVEFTADGQIFNPTNQNAKPLIRIYGTGVVTINGYQMSILSHSQSYVDIDTEIYDAYCNGTNMNRYVAINEFVGFPILKSGNNVVDLGSGITKVEITPRWFEI